LPGDVLSIEGVSARRSEQHGQALVQGWLKLHRLVIDGGASESLAHSCGDKVAEDHDRDGCEDEQPAYRESPISRLGALRNGCQLAVFVYFKHLVRSWIRRISAFGSSLRYSSER